MRLLQSVEIICTPVYLFYKLNNFSLKIQVFLNSLEANYVIFFSIANHQNLDKCACIIQHAFCW